MNAVAEECLLVPRDTATSRAAPANNPRKMVHWIRVRLLRSFDE